MSSPARPESRNLFGTPRFSGPLMQQARSLFKEYLSPPPLRVGNSGFGDQDLTKDITVDFSRRDAHGGYSDIFKGTLKTGGARVEVAVKVHRHAPGDITITLGKLQNEIALWSSFVHPNILQLLGVYFRNGPTHLPGFVSPWCNNGTITDHLKAVRQQIAASTSGTLDNDYHLQYLEVTLLYQATSGLAYLHDRNVIHGDMKACNILVHDGVARLSDFGYSVAFIERSGTTSSRLGTYRWFAPEFMDPGARRTREADMWAMGCVILEVRTLQLPYSDLNDMAIAKQMDKKQPPYNPPEEMNAELRSMAEACWSFLPSARPTSRRIIARLRALAESLYRVYEAFRSTVHDPNAPVTGSESAMKSLLSSLVIMSARDPVADPHALLVVLTKIPTVLGELDALGERYAAASLRPLVRDIANRHPNLAKELMSRLASAELRSPLVGHTACVTSIAFLSDGRRLVSSSQDMTVRIWNIETGATVIGPLEGHTSTVLRVATHGERIASCSCDGTFRVWDAGKGKLVLGPVSAHGGQYINTIAFSKSGTHIASGGHDNRVAVWDAKTGAVLREIVGHEAPVLCVAFSHDGRRLVSGSQDTTVRIWDLASGKCIGIPLTGHSSWVTSVCFTPDDGRMFSSSADTTIRGWSSETRQLFEPLRAGGQVMYMTLSPDGKRLASSSPSGRITLWDAESGAAIPTPFRDHGGIVYGVAFSPHGRRLASASEDKTVAIWDVAGDWKDYDI